MSSLNAIRRTVKEILEMGSKSAILADPKSKAFCQQFASLKDTNDSAQFLRLLIKEHGLKMDKIYNTIVPQVKMNATVSEFEHNFKFTNYEKLSASLKPEYADLFLNLSRVNNGVETLVKIRENLLQVLAEKKKHELSAQEENDLRIMNSTLKNLLTLFFSTGLLRIQQIDWKSPAILVEKVVHYESVHRIRTLADLKNRLSASRRCFIYTHATMPHEPLVILHVALTHDVTAAIGDLIRDSTTFANVVVDHPPFTNAIFYSVNSCQKGLQQVDLGNALIKSAVRLLRAEFPSLRHFHTLSPIPKFKEWLDHRMASDDDDGRAVLRKCLGDEELATLVQIQGIGVSGGDEQSTLRRGLEALHAHINTSEFRLRTTGAPHDVGDETTQRLDRVASGFLRRACAYYLLMEKKSGYAFDAVCNFHLKNGARVFRVNYAAEAREKSWLRSYGLMVNYEYVLDEIETNCVDYLIEKKIRRSEAVDGLLAKL